MSIFKGAGVAIVTPMKENEEVNRKGFKTTARGERAFVPRNTLAMSY